jgi:putative SOS response-associated peptidase YedK
VKKARVRNSREGEVACNLFAFLTTDANADVAPIHPKAKLKIVARGARQDFESVNGQIQGR